MLDQRAWSVCARSWSLIELEFSRHGAREPGALNFTWSPSASTWRGAPGTCGAMFNLCHNDLSKTGVCHTSLQKCIAPQATSGSRSSARLTLVAGRVLEPLEPMDPLLLVAYWLTTGAFLTLPRPPVGCLRWVV